MPTEHDDPERYLEGRLARLVLEEVHACQRAWPSSCYGAGVKCHFLDTPFQVAGLHLVVPVEEEGRGADDASVESREHRAGAHAQAGKGYEREDERKRTGGCSERPRAIALVAAGWCHGGLVECERVDESDVSLEGEPGITDTRLDIRYLHCCLAAATCAAVALTNSAVAPRRESSIYSTV